MTLQKTAEIVKLQQQISDRLLEFGYADGHSAATISSKLAEIAVLSRSFSETTLPLFLSLDRDHSEPIAQLIVSIKCDLEELTDSLRDVEPDLRSLMQFLQVEKPL